MTMKQKYPWFSRIEKILIVLEKINVETFFHIRVNCKNQFFILSNNKPIIDYIVVNRYFGKYVSDIVEGAVCDKVTINSLAKDKTDPFLIKLQDLDIAEGLSLSLKTDDYVDVFFFAPKTGGKNIDYFYLNYVYLLKRFVVYFRIKARDIINNVFLYHSMPLRVPVKLSMEIKEDQMKQKQQIEHFYQLTTPNKSFFKDKNNKIIGLTTQETHCLMLLLQGKSMNSIAKDLNVTQKAIEFCIHKIKIKTGYTSKAELLTNFFDNHTPKPSIFYDRYNRLQ